MRATATTWSTPSEARTRCLAITATTGSSAGRASTPSTAENGDDVLDGGLGADILDGGRGSDVLIGGASSDTLTGGQGEDRFVFSASQGLAGDRDVILDFTRSDRIDLEGLTATISTGADVTGDGLADTVLQLSDDTTVVLSGFTGWRPDLLV